MEETRTKAKAIILKSLLAILSIWLVGCGVVSYGLWYLMKPLSLNAVRTWAILATLVLPVVAGAGFLFGRREARVLTDGLAMGVSEVTKAADEVATLKGKLADRIRQPPVTVQVAAGSLPSPPVHHRRLEGQNETVDL